MSFIGAPAEFGAIIVVAIARARHARGKFNDDIPLLRDPHGVGLMQHTIDANLTPPSFNDAVAYARTIEECFAALGAPVKA